MSLWIDESRWKTHPCVTSPSRWFEAGAACVSRANQCASPIYELPSFHLRLAIVRKQRVFAVGRPLEVFTPRKYTAPENVAKFTRLSKLRNELITQASVALAPCSLSVAPSLSSILSLSFCLSLSVSLGKIDSLSRNRAVRERGACTRNVNYQFPYRGNVDETNVEKYLETEVADCPGTRRSCL